MSKRLSLFYALILILMSFASCSPTDSVDDGKLSIVTTVFPYFDFARELVGEMGNVSMLLPPGSESHSYEPSAKDIIKVGKCDLFIYTGGAGDTWVETILESLDGEVNVLCAMDFVELYASETTLGMSDVHSHDDDGEHEHSLHDELFDEHIWTSPVNARKITAAIFDAICELEISDDERSALGENFSKYDAELVSLDTMFRQYLDGHGDKPLIFGDRFPFRYFVEEYGLDYFAAFPGCSNETEISASNLAFLIDTVKECDISTIFHIEFSNKTIAESIAESTEASTALLHSCHNVSKDEIQSGATYLSLMRRNLETLKEALD